MQTRVDKPLHLHADTVDGGVVMGDVFLETQAFIHNGHAGARVEIRDGVGQLADFFAEGLVHGEEVVCCVGVSLCVVGGAGGSGCAVAVA